MIEIKIDRLLYLLICIFLVWYIVEYKVGHGTVGSIGSRRRVMEYVDQDGDVIEKDEHSGIKESMNITDYSDGVVQCETVIQQSASFTQGYSYQKIQKADSVGGDLFSVKTHDIEALKKMCNALDNCRGFNSNGWLKKNIGNKYKAPSDLYIKEMLKDDDIYLSSQIIEDSYGNNYIKMTKKFKIYIYDIKTKEYIKSQNDYKYGVEQLFIDLLKKSSFVTQNAEEADLFFIPSRCTAYRKSIPDKTKGKEFAKQVMNEIIKEIKFNFTYWERSLGADHFYICAHDIGTLSTEKSDRYLFKNAIALVNTADYDAPFFIPHKDIAVPPNPLHGAGSLPALGRGGADINPNDRNILAFFAGNLDRGRVRPAVQAMWAKDPDFRLFMGQMSNERYHSYLKQSKFCLCLRGNEVWSPRLMDALWFGCIPVIVADYYALPLEGILDWSKFAVVIRESQIDDMKSILKSISKDKISAMQSVIRKIYPHLTWNDPPKPYDAFHSILYQLWQRRHVTRYKTT